MVSREQGLHVEKGTWDAVSDPALGPQVMDTSGWIILSPSRHEKGTRGVLEATRATTNANSSSIQSKSRGGGLLRQKVGVFRDGERLLASMTFESDPK